MTNEMEYLRRERVIARKVAPNDQGVGRLSLRRPWVWVRGLRAGIGRSMSGQPTQKSRSDPTGQGAGFTLIEAMVVIAIIGIATLVAIPSLTSWVVNQRIRNAAGSLQEDFQWGRGYAIKTDQQINFTIQSAVAPNGVTVCTWSFTSAQNNAGVANAAISNAPSMTAKVFAGKYPNTTCQIGASSPVTFTPQGTIMDMGTGQLLNGFYQMSSSSNATQYDTWLVVFYGAGEIRSCIPPSNVTAAQLTTDIGNGTSPCVNQ
ncbi:MAG TPA: prepilin-type N-terminal cleavage/methylation domain-containing protein [Acidiferrobacter sp.]|nr:prepilin-type N-terminal cleavage/methylation domain-containing protein [Acidiferrobacter sp.]